MSWLTPIVREVMSDSAATSHKLQFFENGATINLAITLDPSKTIEQFRQWVKEFRHDHEGVANAYKTLMLGGGATPTPIGSNFQQMDFKTVQGAGETRIAAAGGVPPIIVGLSEGLQAATYSNYGQAMRRFGDITMDWLWGNFCGSCERAIPPPHTSRLWYDTRDIGALKEDGADAANILLVKAQAISALVLAGMTQQSAIDAVDAGDLSQLKPTGLTSVQLQPPLDPDAPPAAPQQPALFPPMQKKGIAVPTNGNGKGKRESARLLSPWLPGEPDDVA
jgi:phage portal protein BeeE